MGRDMPESDSPGAHINPRAAVASSNPNNYSLEEDDAYNGYDTRDTGVFDLTMEDDEGHSILVSLCCCCCHSVCVQQQPLTVCRLVGPAVRAGAAQAAAVRRRLLAPAGLPALPPLQPARLVVQVRVEPAPGCEPLQAAVRVWEHTPGHPEQRLVLAIHSSYCLDSRLPSRQCSGCPYADLPVCAGIRGGNAS